MIDHTPSIDDLLPTIEHHLAEAWGGPVRLTQPEALQERDYVTRLTVLEAPPGAPTHVIVKRSRLQDGQTYDPDSIDPYSPAQNLFDDWAGLQFLSEAAGDLALAPRFYVGDRTRGWFVMEDLGEGSSPDKALLDVDPIAASASLLDIMRCLGQMHARTIGRQNEHHHVRAALGPVVVDASRFTRLAPALRELLGALALTPHPGTIDDVNQVIAALTDPGPFLAFTHGDPCPDNWRRTADGQLRLFDFERGRFRHALLDGVYGTIHFPTCWCVGHIPAEIVTQMETTYRAELICGCPAAADDGLFQRAVVDACAFWVLRWATSEWRGALQILEEDVTWGLATVRQRFLRRADIFTQLTQTSGYLEALGATFADLAQHLRARWPAEADTWPPYPAFA